MFRQFRRLKSFAARRAPALRGVTQDLRWQWLDWADTARSAIRGDHRDVDKLRIAVPAKRARLARIYIDVSVIDQYDAGTGIQRVVRAIRDHLPGALGQGVEVDYLVVRPPNHRYATVDGKPLDGSAGALFFGLDFATDAIFQNRQQLRRFKADGGRMWFLVHDILPLSHPNWFTPSSRVRYRRWLRVCAALADGFFCVSPVVAEQLKCVLSERYARTALPRIEVVQLGSNFTSADRKSCLSDLPDAPGLDSELFLRAALVVGTLEPRKGHADVLDAYDRLWGDGHQLPLILIGKPGWNTFSLQSRIRRHPQHGRLLFWLENVDDHALHAAYRHCRLAIVPSYAEGYGLPLDEALALGASVLARDIPVFRRHDETAVSYFAADAGADSIAAHILAKQQGEKPRQVLPPLRQWEETARQVARELDCAL